MPALPEASSRRGPRPIATSATLPRSLPQFVAERCVGCMACVSACPDSALIARVVPEADVAPAVACFAGEEPDGGTSATDLQAQFVRTKKYAEVPERNGIAPGAFGLFVEPDALQGMRRVCRGVRRPRARRPVHDGQGRG